jgi:transposase
LEAYGFKRGAVKHGRKEWPYYDYRTGEPHHTKHIESFWKQFEASVRSTHIKISSEYMDRYHNEFAFRSTSALM